ncbi:MAG TPA: hypothetical protein VH599_10690 [Ktedonobacterales bacterium]|jgi:hypothetical protein
MPTIKVDCEVVLDGTGYLVKPGTYRLERPRVRRATVRADGAQSYVDLGPGRRVWRFTALALNDLAQYDGTPTGLTGQQYRDALWASYVKVATALSFTDPEGQTVQAYFDDLVERVADLRSQQVGVSYELEVALVEV